MRARKPARAVLATGAVAVAVIVGGACLGPATTAPPPPPASVPAPAPGPNAPPAPVPGAPAGPVVTGVTALPAANGAALVSWAPAANAVSYVVSTLRDGKRIADQPAVGTSALVTGLGVGQTYRFSVSGVGDDQQSSTAAGTTPEIVALGAVAPGPPLSATATADPATNRVTVRWARPASGATPDRYIIAIRENDHPVGAFVCDAPCTERTVALTPGASATFAVTAQNQVGTSSGATSNRVQVSQPCAGACVTVDATATSGDAHRRASGFLHALGPATDPAVVDRLRPRHWRVSGYWNGGTGPRRATEHGATITYLLSDDWHVTTRTATGGATPVWEDWDRYAAFVRKTVRAVLDSGIPVEYWEIQNEPGLSHYYAGIVPTTDQLLRQFEVAYTAIKAVDPDAKVAAPSLTDYAQNPITAAPTNVGLDMRTFLDFAVLHDLRFEAIAFHDINRGRYDDYAPAGMSMPPDEMGRSVGRLRGLLAERPSLGSPAILVTEYAPPGTDQLPGWSVGQIAAVEAANVDEANRTCWSSTCEDGWLDGLLTGDGRTTTPPYWVYAFYTAMSGQRATVSSSNSAVSAFATVDSSAVRVLVGRHDTHVSSTGRDVTLRVRVPFAGHARVVMASIPAGAATLASPVERPAIVLPVAVAGTVEVVLPALADGDAWQLTITPADAPTATAATATTETNVPPAPGPSTPTSSTTVPPAPSTTVPPLPPEPTAPIQLQLCVPVAPVCLGYPTPLL